MAGPRLPLNGQNVAVDIFLGGVRLQNTDTAMNVNIKQKAVKHLDKYLGRKRDRTDKQIDGYTCKMELDYVDAVIVKAIEAQDALRDANNPNTPTMSVGLTFNNRDGTTDGYVLTDCV